MRYFLAFIALLGLIFLLAYLLFHGGGQKPKNLMPFTSYAATNAQAQLTIDGPINADQDHRQIKITVNRDDVTFQLIQGYQGNAINTQTFANNQNAYTNFLFALLHAGFTKGNSDPKLSDERGYCPTGDRYIFQFTQNGNNLERYWATNCGGTKTYGGNTSLTINLFEVQVPDYGKLTQNVAL